MAAWEFGMGRCGGLLLDLLLNCCICLTVVFMLNEQSTFWKKLGLCDLRLQTLRQFGSQIKFDTHAHTSTHTITITMTGHEV